MVRNSVASKYRKLTSFLEASLADAVSLSLDQIDQIVGGLPDSARRYSEWWSNSPRGRWYAQFWMDAGFRATPHLDRGVVDFARVTAPHEPATSFTNDSPMKVEPVPRVESLATPPVARSHKTVDGLRRVGLIGCVKSKQERPAAAKDLYVSTLFRGRRLYVETSCDRYFIISAKYGLVDPDDIIEPYDVAMSQLSVYQRRQWSQKVIRDLADQLGHLSDCVFEIHAGYSYRHFGLVEGLEEAGATVEQVGEDLTFGEQLAFYGQHTGGGPTAATQRIRRSSSAYERIADYLDTTHLDDVTVTFDDLEHAMGRTLPPSASQHAPWWANSLANPQSRDWVSRGWRSHHPRVAQRTVGFRKVTPSPSSQWDATKVSTEVERKQEVRSPLAPEAARQLVDLLLEHGKDSKSRPVDAVVIYTPDAEANRLVLSDPFAFLIAVIFDQGITAERAWNAPYLLRQRLGYFDPARISGDEDAVRRAIQEPPMLHRFKVNMARWVTLAARDVISHYGGDASAIWSDSPTAVELQRRLVQFAGIGQKKAAMAVELLERDLGVVVKELEGSDIAFDVHIRRVLIRTGLAERDDQGEIIDRARALNPERPGSLDHPLWDIGRRWCRPRNPNCGSCPLTTLCPRLLSRTEGLKGVG